MRIREDLPEAQPIIARLDEIGKLWQERWDELDPLMKGLIHPSDLSLPEEREEFHNLKLSIRPKSASEARQDILKRKKERLTAEKSVI